MMTSVADPTEAGGSPAAAPALGDKVAFLGRPQSYPFAVDAVTARETHMSWVFLAGDRVLKLKKPVRFSYLDFSTLARREAACRAELRLNRRLAPDVYLGVVPLTMSSGGLAIGGAGEVVDWLVVMRRLPDDGTLERAILSGRATRDDANRIAATLVAFYRRARRVAVAPQPHRIAWERSAAENRRVLLDPRLGLPAGPVHAVDRIERRFLAEHGAMLAGRARARRIVDAHGDLRPEHIWLEDPIVIIDCLEFNPQLRALDILDELAFLDLECERLGGGWVGERIRRRVAVALRDPAPEPLLLFYRCHRAMLRARLAIAHLLEPNPRTPEKWPRLARLYLALAAADAARLERALRRRGGRRGRHRH
jgi:aminoglycoside phosphotransferase family enzyme